MAVNGVGGDRNYTSMLDGTASTNKVYDAVFGNADDNQLSSDDFYTLMITQLTNQDFMNPVDDTQYIAQMAQFSTMDQMMELCQFSKQNYAMSMLGKEVTIGKYAIGGDSKAITGIVEKVAMEDDTFKLYINGQPYEMADVTQVCEPGKSGSSGNTSTGSNVSDNTQADG